MAAKWSETTETEFGPSTDDRAAAALTEHLTVGSRQVILQVSPVSHFSDYGPAVDVVQTWVLGEDDKLLALKDVFPTVSTEEAFALWNVLCEQLTTAAAMPYGLRVEPGVNPRLGCWGPRPELAAGGTDDDSATALMIGVAVDKARGPRDSDPKLLVLAVRSGMVAALRIWAAAARAASPHSPDNRN